MDARERYEAKFDREPSYAVMQGYDAAIALLDAIGRAGSTDAEKILAALETTDMLGTRGRIVFGTDPGSVYYHQWKDVPVFTLQYIKEGQTTDEATILAPEEFKTGDLARPG